MSLFSDMEDMPPILPVVFKCMTHKSDLGSHKCTNVAYEELFFYFFYYAVSSCNREKAFILQCPNWDRSRDQKATNGHVTG